MIIIILILPWVWLTLEELTAPFLWYTQEMLLYMFIAERAVALYYANDLNWYVFTTVLDAVYKFAIYYVFPASEESDAIQL